MSMNKTLKKKIARTIQEKRQQLLRIREEIEDLIDSLDLIEAREQNAGKPTFRHNEIKKRLGIK